MKTASLLWATLACAVVTAPTACRREETFPVIGTNVASPVDLEASTDGRYFYVLNADFDRTYNKGSVLVVDTDGNKLGAVEVPRMGRSITVSGTDMLVTVDYQDEEGGGPKAYLFSLADPVKPALVKEWSLKCSPYNAVMRQDPSAPGQTYKFFAVTCLDGPLYVGRLADDRAQSTLKQVRNYGITRRALYLDPKRNLLLGFTTDPSKQTWSDQIYVDEKSVDQNGNVIPDAGPNEIPDERGEKTKTAVNDKGWRGIYQFFAYDLAAESQAQEGCAATPEDDCTFPFRKGTDPVVEKELRWIYFKLKNFDGTPDDVGLANDPLKKYYRTNFYQARPDPLDADSFYLSHRGPPKDTGSPHANQIVKVTFVGDLRPGADGKVPHTGDVLVFERAYGFKGGEATLQHYPGDFDVVDMQGQRLLLVNHFRDLVNWVRGDVYFSLAAKTLDDNTWFTELPGHVGSGNDIQAFYQVALTDQGRAITCNYYGNALEILQITPGVGFSKVADVK